MALGNILKRMRDRQPKKTSMLRHLGKADSFVEGGAAEAAIATETTR